MALTQKPAKFLEGIFDSLFNLGTWIAGIIIGVTIWKLDKLSGIHKYFIALITAVSFLAILTTIPGLIAFLYFGLGLYFLPSTFLPMYWVVFKHPFNYRAGRGDGRTLWEKVEVRIRRRFYPKNR